MDVIELIIFDLIGAIMLTSVLCAFTYVLPRPTDVIKRQSNFYLRAYLFSAGLTCLAAALRLFTSDVLSILLQGILFLLAAYMLVLAVRSRYGLAVSRHWHALYISHILIFSLTQLFLVYGIDNGTLRGINAGIHAAIPISVSIYTIANHKRNIGDSMLMWALLLALLAAFLVTAAHQWIYTGDDIALVKLHLLVFLMLTGFTFCGFVLSIIYSLIARLKHDKQTDPLTLIHNRHYLDDDKVQGWLSADTPHGHSVVACDLDHFKQINDQYGHQVGDRVLVHFTQLVKNRLRPHDVFVRMGGEEFLLVLRNTALDRALAIAERLRCQIEESPLHIDDERCLIATCSFGLVSYHCEQSLDDNLRRADEALYAAKAAGRNQICQK